MTLSNMLHMSRFRLNLNDPHLKVSVSIIY